MLGLALAVGFVVGRTTAPKGAVSPIGNYTGTPATQVSAIARAVVTPGVPVVAGPPQEEHITLATWNVRGYPEKRESDTTWFHGQLRRIGMDVLCIEEIASQGRVDELRERDGRLTQCDFVDSHQGQGNAILADGRVTMQDMPDPSGF